MSTEQRTIKGFMRLEGVLKLIPVSRSNWLEGVKTGKYPVKPVHLSERIVAYRVEDIENLIAAMGRG